MILVFLKTMSVTAFFIQLLRVGCILDTLEREWVFTQKQPLADL